MTQGEWAAWAQAILSVLAIIAAALFPNFQESARTRRRIDTYAAMVRAAFVNASRDSRRIQKGVGGAAAAHWPRERWDRLRDAFLSVPYYDLPDYRLFNVLHDAAEAVDGFREIWFECIDRAHTNYPITEDISMRAEGIRAVLQDSHETALQIRDTYAQAAVLQKVKERWFLVKLRRAVRKNKRRRRVG